MKKDLAEIASENGLQLIETTASRTGYPERLQKAIIGFDTFEQAEELAKENGLSIEFFRKRDGWNFWYRTGSTAYEPFRRSAEDFGDDYSEFSKEDLEDFYENEVQPMVSDFENFDDLRSFLAVPAGALCRLPQRSFNSPVVEALNCLLQAEHPTLRRELLHKPRRL